MRTKRLASILSLLLLFGLLLHSEDALISARDGFTLVFTAVVPALFPFFAVIGILESHGFFFDLSRLLSGLSKRLHLPDMFLPCLIIGAASGYPSGARMCAGAGLYRCAPLCNLCSPVFIVGIAATGLFGDIRAAAPMLIGHYGAAVLTSFCALVFCPSVFACGGTTVKQNTTAFKHKPLTEVLSEAMRSMLRITGCIVFFLVVSALCRSFGIFRFLSAPLTLLGIAPEMSEAFMMGLLEFTGGCQALSAVNAALRVRAALSVFLITFGGFSVWLQSALFIKMERPGEYLCIRLVQGVLAGALCYLLFPLFYSTAQEAMAATAEQMQVNAVTGLSLFIASSATLACIYLAAKICRGSGRNARTRRNRIFDRTHQ